MPERDYEEKRKMYSTERIIQNFTENFISYNVHILWRACSGEYT